MGPEPVGQTTRSAGRRPRRSPARFAPLRGRSALGALVAALALPALGGSVSAQGVTDPPANMARTAAMTLACQSGSQLACQQAVVAAIDQARAAEGVGPLVLPANYDSLNVPEQLLVLADLERVDRGLPGFSGLSSALDALASSGAQAGTDPTGPAGSTWGSNWAGGEASALLADYDWMYDDGPGSPNMDCTAAQPGGCWDHRNNILGDYGPEPSMGAAEAIVDGVTSMTEVFSSAPPGQLDFSMPAGAAPVPEQPAGQGEAPPNEGLLQIASNGTVFSSSFSSGGTALALAAPRVRAGGPIVGVEAAPDGRGYWEVSSSGAVFNFGDAKFYGSTVPLHLRQRVVGMAVARAGKGYWLATANGGVYSYGDAHFFGTPRGHAGSFVVGIVASPLGKGYWLFTSHGAVYSFGRARFFGPDHRLALSAPVVGMAATHDGHGYWLVTKKGRVYAFGDAKDFGGSHVRGTVVGIAVPPVGNGYWLALRDGAVLSFGGAALLAGRVAGRAQRATSVVGVAAA